MRENLLIVQIRVPLAIIDSFKDSIDTLYDNIAEGDWTLKIGDHGPGDVGTLNNWSLELCFEEIELSNTSINSIDFEVYPNPAQSQLYLNMISKFNNGFNVDLYDVNGRIVLSEQSTNNSSQNIDVSQFKRGLYFIKITQNNQTKVNVLFLTR